MLESTKQRQKNCDRFYLRKSNFSLVVFTNIPSTDNTQLLARNLHESLTQFDFPSATAAKHASLHLLHVHQNICFESNE